MSAEVVSVILAAAVLLITLGSCYFVGFAWLKRRMDERFDEVAQRFDKIDQRLDTVDERMSRVLAELNEVKVPVTSLAHSHDELTFRGCRPHAPMV